MYELKKKLESYLRVNLLGPGPRLIKELPGRGLTEVEKHWYRTCNCFVAGLLKICFIHLNVLQCPATPCMPVVVP
jgi:hypothetical protein